MDNLTHSLVGWVLAETGLKRRTRKGLAACVLAANMPDIDVFFGWAPWEPLATHRGFTHGLVGGVLLMPPLLAALLWLLDRWQTARGKTFASGLPMHFGWLVALCYLGAATHPLLDLQNTYAIQLLSPASTHWFHTDGLFIISPWLLVMLGTGIWLSRRRARRGRPKAGKPAMYALAGVAAFIGLNIAISALAWQLPAKAQAGVAPDRVFASAEPLLFWRRDVLWRANGMIGAGRYDPLSDPAALTDVVPAYADNMADADVRRAGQATADIGRFLKWSQMPFARKTREGCTVEVTFSDARFTDPMVSSGFIHTVRIPASGAGC